MDFVSESPRIAWETGGRVFCRELRLSADGKSRAVLAVRSASEPPEPEILERFAHEYSLKDVLDPVAAARPLLLLHERGRPCLILEDCGDEPLERIPVPMHLRDFLRLAVGIAASLSRLHAGGLIHKDIKPAHILVNRQSGESKFTGFGIATLLPRERQTLELPEFIAGTLAFMSPEQTGRINRSIDARSDLYSLGVTLYLLATGSLPFIASDAMEWVHCHIARQAVPPSERAKHIPQPVSRIVMKLLAKTPEDRYQTASGVEHDLRRCLNQWETQGRISDFSPGECDVPDHLLIPEKLYGRSRETEVLVAAFDRVVGSGAPALVLVAGYSGIGKSSVVNELHKALVPPRGLFAAGKFDQYKRDIPYSTLIQAFQSLVRPLLSKPDAELSDWRDAILQALGPNARLMIELIPELELIIGAQPPVPELPSQQAKSRFQLVFQSFIGVFARPEHPLALFLDDLQWLDAATLDLLEHLLIRSDLRHLLLIGAYRDNEVDATHPLTRKVEIIRNAGVSVEEFTLGPLTRGHVAQLIADAICCKPEYVEPLAQWVHARTGGNPFFVSQFLHSLADEKLLAFDHRAMRWTWDIKQIQAMGYTDNVVDLMTGKLTRLPVHTQHALQQLACLGNRCSVSLLSVILDTSEGEVHSLLWPAVRHELIDHLGGAYRFIHDRVREAAYSSIPETLRAQTHLRIGRLLAAHTPPEKQEEMIFDIVGQINRGTGLIKSQDERWQLAELNLIAGRRARTSSAYASALAYLGAGAALLTEDCWVRRHELCFSVELLRAECEFLTGATADAQTHLGALAARAATTVERAAVACLGIDLCFALGNQSDRALTIGLEYLQSLGGVWSLYPTDAEARGEYERVLSCLGERTHEELINLPLITDPASLSTLRVLLKLGPPSLQTNRNANLFVLLICRAVNLSLECGHSDGSCYAYAFLGLVACTQFGDYQVAFRLGQLGCDLADYRDLRQFEAATRVTVGGCLMHWTRHIRDCRDMLHRAFEAANRDSDIHFDTHCRARLSSTRFASGDPLPDVLHDAEQAFAFVRKTQYGSVADNIGSLLQLVRTLRGLTSTFGCFDDEQFDELAIERRFSTAPGWGAPECLYWIRKLQARFFAGNHAAALDASQRAQRLLGALPASFETADYSFYTALSHASACDSDSADELKRHVESLAEHQKQFETWAENCPDNFESRAALVGAEIARLEGRVSDAERLYERAIRSAHENGFVHVEALAYELVARFYSMRGLETFAQVFLRNARDRYLRWGADGKVRQLEQMHPQLGADEPVLVATKTIGAALEHLDLATVIKVLQAASGEIELEKLLNTLLRTALEHAGAERGLLILSRDGEQRIAAEATTGSNAVVVRLCDESATAVMLPEAVLQYVVRTREAVILDDASAVTSFATDPYIGKHEARSILCLPLINQTRLIGTLYLENNLAARVFVPGRIAVLTLLASQAAITLENARLYHDLAERERRIRRLVDANIVGILIWDTTGHILEANDAFLRIVGYERDDLMAGHVRWKELTPPEWLDIDKQSLQELRTTGTLQPFEKQYFRKDGSRASVLVGLAMFESDGSEGVGFVLDLTERKRIEAEARENERRYCEIETELAHANRVAMMGQLSASIAHEVKQPVTAMSLNASVASRWLETQPPNVEEARQLLRRIVEDCGRAGRVVNGIQELFRKAPPRKEHLDINEMILEVSALMRSEANRNGVTVELELGENLSPILGDRVQLQQVVVNLLVNAIQAMSTTAGRSRQLRIHTASDSSNGVSIAVRDSGSGLPSVEIKRVFDPFYTTKAHGLGMGLSICRSIVEAHGGLLQASANAPHGAVFEFVLPASETDMPRPAEAKINFLPPGCL